MCFFSPGVFRDMKTNVSTRLVGFNPENVEECYIQK